MAIESWPTPLAAIVVNEACLGHFEHAHHAFVKSLEQRANRAQPGQAENAKLDEAAYMFRICFQRYVFDTRCGGVPNAFAEPGMTQTHVVVEGRQAPVPVHLAPPEHRFVAELFMAFVNEDEAKYAALMRSHAIFHDDAMRDRVTRRVYSMVHGQYRQNDLKNMAAEAREMPDTVPEEWLS